LIIYAKQSSTFISLFQWQIHMRKKPNLYLNFMLLTGLATLFMSYMILPKHITVYLAGDSTMADKEAKAYPETGWGMPFHNFFDNTVTVKNIARNGRSTKTFITGGLWKAITDSLKKGDYVLIQFGHNDEVPTKKSFTTEDEFTANLTRFIKDVRSENSKPVLITPVARRKFNPAGQIEATHEVYAAIVRKVAAEQHVPLIDLDRESQALLQKAGPEESKRLFNHLRPGEHPNYPDGKADDTHFSELGARKMAEIVVSGIRALQLDLAKRIINSKPLQ
jgi:lysophospholipase L1-like esterase